MKKDRKESFLYNYMPEEDPIVPNMTPGQFALLAHNIWLVGDEFNKQSFAYMRSVFVLVRKMMRTFALGLDLEENYSIILSLRQTPVKKIHHPPQSEHSSAENGTSSHPDFVYHQSNLLIYFLILEQ